MIVVEILIAVLAVAIVVGTIVFHATRRRRKSSSCGSGCSSCPYCSSCSTKKK